MLRRVILLSCILTLASLGGITACGDGSSAGNGNDATISSDASPVPDGAVGVDNDQDGYPTDQDCDDNDPAVFPGVRRPCQSECDVGTETCLANGTWNTCTARADCDCSNPGETRIIVCGNCGQASQECGLDLKWGMPGDCFGQGECSPGQVDASANQCAPYCGPATRLCSNECTWGPTEGCVTNCLPGEERYEQSSCSEAWEHAVEHCTGECVWEVTVPCTADCLLPARTGTTDFKDEICIPGGLAVMGYDGLSWASPKHVVALSPYFIDKYEVTVARYRECVQAGVCQAPSCGTYYAQASDTLPISCVSHSQMRAYCQWDGGRDLPTEARWEKAARGPSPSEILRPWGSDAATCEHVPSRPSCGDTGPAPVGSHAAGASPNGVEDMGGNLSEFVLETYYYYLDTGTVELDPVGAPSGSLDVVSRGRSWDWNMLSDHVNCAVDRRDYSPDGNQWNGFRCARAGF